LRRAATQKFGLDYKNAVIPHTIFFIGGWFQLANKADLSDTVTAFKVKKLPYYQTEVIVKDRKKFRHLVYQFKDVPVTYIPNLLFTDLTRQVRK